MVSYKVPRFCIVEFIIEYGRAELVITRTHPESPLRIDTSALSEVIPYADLPRKLNFGASIEER